MYRYLLADSVEKLFQLTVSVPTFLVLHGNPPLFHGTAVHEIIKNIVYRYILKIRNSVYLTLRVLCVKNRSGQSEANLTSLKQ